MAFVAAKCTQCGANIEVDDTKDAGICQHCGTAFVTEKAINNYNTYVTNNVVNNNSFIGTTINVSNTVDVDNLFELANSAIDAEDKTKATLYLDEIIKLDSRNVKAWEMKADCAYGKSQIAYVSNAIKFADEEQKERLEHKYYFQWAKAWLNDMFMNAVPNEAIAKDISLQNYIIEMLNSGIDRYISEWDEEYNKGLSVEILNNRVDNVNAFIDKWITKFPDDKKTSLKKANHYEKRGCYIATCVYGSYDCPQVWTLRRFRDYTLGETWYGRLFIKCYYAISPTLVKWFGETKWFRSFWKERLDKMVFRLNEKGVDNTYYNDRH